MPTRRVRGGSGVASPCGKKVPRLEADVANVVPHLKD
jgi:hypothetical protein